MWRKTKRSGRGVVGVMREENEEEAEGKSEKTMKSGCGMDGKLRKFREA